MRTRALVVLLGSVTAIAPLSMDMYLPAFPAIAGDLGVPAARVQLSLTACVVGIAAGQVLFGPLSDRWGRRKLLVTGISAYAVMSLLIAFVPSAEALTALRLLQGVGGGIGIVVARAIVRDLYSGAEAARFFSRLTLIFGVAPVLAPSIGGLLLRVTSWHGIFVALAAIAVLLAVAIARLLPETLPPERRSTGGLGEIGRTARTLIRDRVFVGYGLTLAFASAGLYVYLAGSPFVLQDGFGVSPGVYGLLFGLNALFLVALSQLNARLAGRVAPRRLLVLMVGVQALSGLGVLLAALSGSLLGVCAALFIMIGSLGMIPANATALALDRYPERAGTAAALLGGVQSLVAAAAAPLAGTGDAESGVPMGAAILVFASAALAVLLTFTRSGGPRRPSAPPASPLPEPG